jgi:hypothetical protein
MFFVKMSFTDVGACLGEERSLCFGAKKIVFPHDASNDY